jgi:tripartite-type tricarboxylate transporter receptor subunit TctC
MSAASRRAALALLTTAALAARRPAIAQGAAPQRILVGFGAGSIPDMIARRYAERLSAAQARPVLVENRVGAGGRLAIAALRQAPADGSVWLLAPGAAVTIAPFLYAQAGYDADRDLLAASSAAETGYGLAVGPAVPAAVTDLRGFLGWARANPARLSFAHTGRGGFTYLLPARLLAQAGLDATDVAYPGGPPALLDMIAGRVALMVLPEGLMREPLAAGRLRVLAHSGAGASAFLPGVPGLPEAGFPDLETREWFGFFLPGGATPGVMEAAALAVRVAATDPPLAQAFAAAALTPVHATPAETVARIAAERPGWREHIARSGISIE